MKDRNLVDKNGRGSWEKQSEVEGGKTVMKIYRMRKKSILIIGKKEKNEEELKIFKSKGSNRS